MNIFCVSEKFWDFWVFNDVINCYKVKIVMFGELSWKFKILYLNYLRNVSLNF